MAGVELHASSGPVALPAANGSKVLYQVKAATGHRAKIKGFGVSMAGIASNDTPILFKITRSTAGTGGISGGTIAKKNDTDGETIQTTGGTTWATSPPAAGSVVWQQYVHPQTAWKEFFPPGSEIVIPNGEYVAVECAAGAVLTGPPNCTVELDIEE